MLRHIVELAIVIGAVAACLAQQPATSQATSQPAAAGEHLAITARVLEVQGDVQHAPLESTDWQPCHVDEQYPEQTVILTGVRSSIKLQIGEDDTYTALVIEPVSRTILSEAYQTSDTKRVRVGVGYGRMRAGVAEGGLKSDFTVDSPVATLSKRGTWDFGLFYERGTERFEIFLLDQGLVDAFSKITGQHRTLLPREVVTQTMRRWADEAQYRRNVPIPDMFGQADVSVAFNTLKQSGLYVINPEGGQATVLDLSSSAAQNQFADLARQQLTQLPGPVGTLVRPEGFFGTGRGDQLIPLIIEPGSLLSRQGHARPGTYTFRRSALEGWLQGQAARGGAPRGRP